MSLPYPVIRLRNAAGEVGGQWYDTPGVVGRVRRELAAHVAEEPRAGWRIETRGFARDWHAMETPEPRYSEACAPDYGGAFDGLGTVTSDADPGL